MPVDFLAHFADESRRTLTAFDAVEPDTAVPTCPDWSAADLLWHLAEGQRFWATIITDRLQTLEDTEAERPDDSAEIRAAFVAANAALHTALADTDDDVAVWTWFDADRTVAFIRRRQAHEALIHRIDAELTAGATTSIDEHLATDGIKEAMEWIFGGAPGWASSTAFDGPVGRVSTTDTEDEWFVSVGQWSGTSPNKGIEYRNDPLLQLRDTNDMRTTDFAIAGPAVDLDLWMWNRGPAGRLTIEGDVAAFRAVIEAGDK